MRRAGVSVFVDEQKRTVEMVLSKVQAPCRRKTLAVAVAVEVVEAAVFSAGSIQSDVPDERQISHTSARFKDARKRSRSGCAGLVLRKSASSVDKISLNKLLSSSSFSFPLPLLSNRVIREGRELTEGLISTRFRLVCREDVRTGTTSCDGVVFTLFFGDVLFRFFGVASKVATTAMRDLLDFSFFDDLARARGVGNVPGSREEEATDESRTAGDEG